MELKLLSVERIWDKAGHNALTDLIRYNERWFCTFRESDEHQNSLNGTIRVLYSDDLQTWKSVHWISDAEYDLRDPKFSINPDGKLLLHLQKVKLEGGKVLFWQPQVCSSQDGLHWSSPADCFSPGEWPWRITWHEGKAYAVSYRFSDQGDRYKPWLVSLCRSDDAIHFDKICSWNIAYYPSEATIRFRADGQMIIFIRRREKELKEWKDPNWIGLSDSPYTSWRWHATGHHLGGPNFLLLNDGSMCAAGRILWVTPYGLMAKTAVGELTEEDFHPQIILPSAGDCSYPGMVALGDRLYVSYYSSHENNTSIYLAKIALEN